MRIPFTTLVVAGSLLLLAACGSSGGGYSSSSSATPAQSVAALATQSGSSSSGGNYGYPPAAASSPSSATGTAGSVIAVAQNPKLGKVLTDARGMTLYTNKKDESGESYCTGSCTSTWPPLKSAGSSPITVNGLTGKFAVLSRDDGSKQVTYNGKPLYTYSGDKAVGDTNGQGVGGLWFAATP